VEKASKSLKKLANTEIVEFKTYVREDAPNVHAHLFEPLYVTEKVSEEGKEEEAAQGRYTESYHLKNVAKDIISVYEKIKNAMLQLDFNIKINPQKYYISLRKSKNFAYIMVRRRKMHIIIMLPYEVGNSLIKKHKLTQLSQGIQNFYNGQCFQVTLENEGNLEEIIKALEEAYKQQG
jgi:predicted transport protein